MTLPLIESIDIEAAQGPMYKMNDRCASPYCENASMHGHHLVRRTRTGGPADWVRLPDGTVIANKVGLCYQWHDQVTGMVGGHQAAIRWEDGKAWWCGVSSGNGIVRYQLLRPLTYQPAILTDAGVVTTEYPKEEPQADSCPTCGKRKTARKRSAARKRKTYTVQVPDDMEDGAQALDDMVDALVDIFELDPEGGALTRYHALSRACAFTVVNREHVPIEAKEIT